MNIYKSKSEHMYDGAEITAETPTEWTGAGAEMKGERPKG